MRIFSEEHYLSVDFGLKVGLSNEYDSLSEDADSKNDFKYTGALVWDL